MPFDGSGNFSRLYNWQSDRDNGIRILAARMDGECDNFAAGFNVVFFRNGLIPMSGNINMGQNYIIGLGAGAVGAPSIRFADDPNTGLFMDGYGQFGLVAGGVKRLNATNAGVGVFGLFNASGNATFGGALTVTGSSSVGGTLDVTGASTFAGPATFNINNNTAAIFGGAAAGANNRIVFQNNMQRWGVGADGSSGNIFYIYNFNTGTNSFTISPVNHAAVFAGPLSTGSTFNATGAITQNGSQVWHAGNLTPGNYAPLAGAAFTGPVTGTTLGLSGGLTATTGTFSSSLSATTGVFSSTLNAVGAITQNGSQVWHAGNLTPGNYAPLAGATFTGLIAHNAGLTSTTGNFTGALTQNGNQVWHAGNLTPGNYALLASTNTFTALNDFSSFLRITGAGGAPGSGAGVELFYSGGVGTVQAYDRGGAAYLPLRLTGSTVNIAPSTTTVAAVGSTGVAVTGTLSATGAITQNGSQVWHAGNLTPADYAPLAGGQFSGTVTFAINNNTAFNVGGTLAGANNRFVLRNDANRWGVGVDGGSSNIFYVYNFGLSHNSFSINPSTDAATFAGALNAVGAITQNGSQVWHAGNLTPSNYAPLAGATFTGAISRSSQGPYANDGMSRASAKITDGTAAPSGGSDGDIYFQYV